MREATAWWLLATAALLLGGGTARAQSAIPDNTAPYRHVYEISPNLYDQCGDVVRGDLYRKVVVDKVNHCPFTEAEKADFRNWASARSAEFAAQSAQAAAHGPVPSTPDVAQRCKALDGEPAMREARRRIDAYGRGKGTADDVIQETCRPAQP